MWHQIGSSSEIWHLAVTSSALETVNSLETLWALSPACPYSIFIAVNKAISLRVYLGLGRSERLHIIWLLCPPRTKMSAELPFVQMPYLCPQGWWAAAARRSMRTFLSSEVIGSALCSHCAHPSQPSVVFICLLSWRHYFLSPLPIIFSFPDILLLFLATVSLPCFTSCHRTLSSCLKYAEIR